MFTPGTTNVGCDATLESEPVPGVTLGTVFDATGVQMAPAIDQRFAAAAQVPDLGVSVSPNATGFKLWAPTAQRVRGARPLLRGCP